MSITLPVTMTEKTHRAFMLYCENLESDDQRVSANVLAGELLSEALRLYGFLERAERVKFEEEVNISEKPAARN